MSSTLQRRVSQRGAAGKKPRSQEASVVEHIDDLGYGLEFVLRNREPDVERLKHLSPDVFAGHRAYVCEWL